MYSVKYSMIWKQLQRISKISISRKTVPKFQNDFQRRKKFFFSLKTVNFQIRGDNNTYYLVDRP